MTIADELYARIGVAAADLATLPAPEHHIDHRERCGWCGHRVFFYTTTPDGARHYCRSCIPRITAHAQEVKL